ncbi:tetraacyldisaccharide 4'-kinase [Achromatium sp. WMS2]|nr:tetraacyldisaccharide 4'-kinase [Achromatium sp. WMS2]
MDKQLLDILACPRPGCKTKLRYSQERMELICPGERLAYPIRDGIPALQIEDAREMVPEEDVPPA